MAQDQTKGTVSIFRIIKHVRRATQGAIIFKAAVRYHLQVHSGAALNRHCVAFHAGGSIKAAFGETLHVDAMATDGWGRLNYLAQRLGRCRRGDSRDRRVYGIWIHIGYFSSGYRFTRPMPTLTKCAKHAGRYPTTCAPWLNDWSLF